MFNVKVTTIIVETKQNFVTLSSPDSFRTSTRIKPHQHMSVHQNHSQEIIIFNVEIIQNSVTLFQPSSFRTLARTKVYQHMFVHQICSEQSQ